MDVRLTTSDGSQAVLPSDLLDRLASTLPGRLHAPGSRDFDQACTIWNAMIERRPGLVVRCSSTADVSQGIFETLGRLKRDVEDEEVPAGQAAAS